jgi:hypothetical protein
MTIFEQALRKGLDAHGRAAAARKEIMDVLAEASREVTSVLREKIELLFDVRSRAQRALSVSERLALIPAPREKYVALVARAAGNSVVLADVELGDLGYPVQLRWGDHVAYADDREGFIAALTELLESPLTGEHIAKLVTGSVAAPTTDSPEPPTNDA